MSVERFRYIPTHQEMQERMVTLLEHPVIPMERGGERALSIEEIRRLEAVLSRTALLEGRRWQDFALCQEADPELFFPHDESKTHESQINAAKKVRVTCTAVIQCDKSADPKHGIWTGKTQKERSSARRRINRMQTLVRERSHH